MSGAQELVPAINKLLEVRIDQAVEDVIREAKTSFESRLRREIAGVALEVTNFYEVRREGSRLIIEVRIDDSKG